MREIKIGLCGANWMGIYHSIGMHNVRQAYTDVVPVFEIVADLNQRYNDAWAIALDDPDITTDTYLYDYDHTLD